MTDLTSLADVVKSPSVERMLSVVKAAIYSLTHTFIVVQDDFSAESVQMPSELRTTVPLQIFDAQLRVELAILSVTVHGAGICSANFALKVTEPALGYNVTLNDRDRLFAGIAHLFDGATMIYPEGYEDSLGFYLPPRDLDA